MPFVKPFLFLLHQIWPSDTDIVTLPPSFPVLFLAGGEDELIPPPHMVELHRLCTSEQKGWKLFRHGTHNDTCLQAGYFQAIAEFLKRHTEGEGEDEKASVREKADSSSPMEKVTLSESESEGSGAGDAMTGSSGGESFELVEKEQEVLKSQHKL